MLTFAFPPGVPSPSARPRRTCPYGRSNGWVSGRQGIGVTGAGGEPGYRVAFPSGTSAMRWSSRRIRGASWKACSRASSTDPSGHGVARRERQSLGPDRGMLGCARLWMRRPAHVAIPQDEGQEMKYRVLGGPRLKLSGRTAEVDDASRVSQVHLHRESASARSRGEGWRTLIPSP